MSPNIISLYRTNGLDSQMKIDYSLFELPTEFYKILKLLLNVLLCFNLF